ncbi:uncharacterized protein LOC135266775 [Tribolium castaneum]|uniref:uncharacterized protein LOC135266775 n=1 Tax=Tribolium castaneum TaxID=7070 RepID=UPI0030FE55F3
MEDEKGNKFTAQGGSSPVPVAGGGKAGLSRPSASNRGASSVGNQAEMLLATGEKEKDQAEGAGRASGSMVDTPKTGPLHSRLNLTSRLQRCSSLSEGSTKKRKYVDSSPSPKTAYNKKESAVAFSAIEAIGNIVKIAEKLNNTIKASYQPKKEIVHMVESINRNTKVFANESIKAWLEEVRWEPVERITYDADAQTDPPQEAEDTKTLRAELEAVKQQAAKQAKEIEILKRTLQDLEREREQKQGVDATAQSTDDDKESIRREILTQMDRPGTYAEVERVLNLEWPQDVYQATKVIKGSPLAASRDWDLGIFLNEEDGGLDTTAMGRLFKERYPELVEEEEEQDDISYIVQTTKFKSKVNTKYVWKIRIEKSMTNWEDKALNAEILKKLRDIADAMQVEGRVKVAIPIPPRASLDQLRKLAEIAFRNKGRELAIHVPQNFTVNGIPTANPNPKQTKRRGVEKQTGALIVRKPGCEYIDLLKKVKKTLGNSENLKIYKALKTNKGDLLIVTENNEEALANARKTIVEEDNAISVTISRPRGEGMELHIGNIEADITAEQISEAVGKKMEVQPQEIVVKALRKGPAEMQVATIQVKKDLGESLLTQRQIRIGLCLCTTTEKVELVRCYKCWGQGHISTKCSGPERKNLCRKCGKPGHKISDCRGNEYCLQCNEEGHRTGSNKCPVRRKEVRKLIRSISTAKNGHPPQTEEKHMSQMETEEVGKVPEARTDTAKPHIEGDLPSPLTSPDRAGAARSGTVPPDTPCVSTGLPSDSLRLRGGGGRGRPTGRPDKIKVLQCNLNRSREAFQLLHGTVHDRQIDIAVVAEPNKKLSEMGPWTLDRRKDVAIRQFNKAEALRKHIGNGFVGVEYRGYALYGCYISPNSTLDEFKQLLRELEGHLNSSGEECIIVGDFNAKSPAWGSKKEDERGRILMDWIAQRDYTIQNTGDEPTFVRGESVSNIDLTITSTGLADKIKNWKVLPEENLSDHRDIYFEICKTKEENEARTKRVRKSWKIDGEGLNIYRELVRKEISGRGRHWSTGTLMQKIEEMCNSSFATCRGGHPAHKRPVYWWNRDIAEQRAKCLKARRTLGRGRKCRKTTSEQIQQLEDRYRMTKKELRGHIKKAKQTAWKELIEMIEEDPWGKGYKVAMGKFRKETPPSKEETKEAVKKLFPRRERTVWQKEPCQEKIEFSEQELRDAASRLRVKRAPGPDGIQAEIVKLVVEEATSDVLAVINASAGKGEFPTRWKEAKLVLIPKTKQDSEGIRKFRPICLLDIMGKLFEHLIRSRLEKELDEKGGLADSQFGFRKGRSTLDAMEEVLKFAETANRGTWGRKDLCAIVAIDVENAFNSAPWKKIIEALEGKRINKALLALIQDYLQDRGILVGEGEEYVEMTCGVPQGSVLGPTLWNVLYDAVLRLEMPVGVRTLAFADDLAVLVSSRNEEEMMALVNQTLQKVAEWMEDTGLSVAAHKTEATLLTGRRRPREIKFSLMGEDISPQTSIKYLGVRLDKELRFAPHVEEVAAKAERTMAALSRLMPNTGGAKPYRRRMLVAVARSQILYGAEIWGSRHLKSKSLEKLERAQRTALLRVTSAYRTTSNEALQVIAGTKPMALAIEERVEIRRMGPGARKAVEDRTRRKWQAAWQNAQNGAWTRKLIPDIGPWLDRKQGHTDFYLTQALTGHGCFGTYLHRIGKTADERCWFCGEDRDDPEHTLFLCERFDGERLEYMKKTLTWPNAEEFVEVMLSSEENWASTSQLVRNIIRTKEREELRREGRLPT